MSKFPPRTTTISSAVTAVGSAPPTKGDQGEAHNSPYLLSADEVLTNYEVDGSSGLTAQQAGDRKQRYGANELEGGEGVSWVRVLVGQMGAYIC